MSNDNIKDGAIPSGAGIDAMPRAVTAFFDTREAADKAKQDLIAAGVPNDDIRLAGGAAPAPHPAHGFWETLRDFFMPDADRHLYAEGLRRGGFAVSVKTDSAAYDHVLEVLDRDGAVDMEERSAGWRDEGWTNAADPSAWAAEERSFTPPGGSTAGFGASMADQPLINPPLTTGEMEPGLVPDLAEDRMRADAAPNGTSDATRDLSHGRTRVRSYIVDARSGDARDP